MFEHKQFGTSIRIKKSKFSTEIQNAIENAQECLMHKMASAIRGEYGRLYGRGKNRCKRCGTKLEVRDEAIRENC